MKITIIGPFPPFRGGISDFNHSLSLALEKHHNLQLINFSTQYPQFLFPGKTQYKSNFDTNFKSEQILSSINPLSWKKSVITIKDFGPDLILFQYWMPFFTFAYNFIIKKIKRSFNSEIISICHNLTPHENRGYYRRLTKNYLNKLKKFIVMSDAVLNDLRNFNPEAKHIKLFHPVYEIYGEEIEQNIAKKNLEIESKSVILFFGLVREYKGLDVLLRSTPLIAESLKDFKILIAGESYENPNKYLKIIYDLNIKKYVRWDMDFIPDDMVSVYFSAADVVVLPYKSATQSGITKLAYNFNRPVILSDVGGLPEIVKNGETGFIVKPKEEAIANAIITFYKENRFDEFHNNVKEFKRQYSWDYFVTKLLEFCDK
jgi:glycosyltransferase involved in cell wall biosynthesis